MRKALVACKIQFRFYADEHLKKSQSLMEAGSYEQSAASYTKAMTNFNMVAMCDEALSAPVATERDA